MTDRELRKLLKVHRTSRRQYYKHALALLELVKIHNQELEAIKAEVVERKNNGTLTPAMSKHIRSELDRNPIGIDDDDRN